MFSDVDGVVEGAEGGLEEEAGDDGEADDGVVFVDLYVNRSALVILGARRERERVNYL